MFLGELESELQKVLMERSEVHEALGKAEAQVISLEEDKKKLLEEVRNVREWNSCHGRKYWKKYACKSFALTKNQCITWKLNSKYYIKL